MAMDDSELSRFSLEVNLKIKIRIIRWTHSHLLYHFRNNSIITY
jgi:hypothetical protein